MIVILKTITKHCTHAILRSIAETTVVGPQGVLMNFYKQNINTRFEGYQREKKNLDLSPVKSTKSYKDNPF